MVIFILLIIEDDGHVQIFILGSHINGALVYIHQLDLSTQDSIVFLFHCLVCSYPAGRFHDDPSLD